MPAGAAEDRQRQPDLGVEVLRAGVDAAGQQRAGDVLDRGLADRAGDPDHPRAERPPPLPGQRLQRGQRVGGGEAPSRPSSPGGAIGGSTTTPQAPAASAAAANSPPSARSPAQAEEEVPGAGLARVDRRPLRARRRPPRRRSRPRSPRRSAAADRARSRPPSLRSSSRATSRSSKGILRPPSNSWPCSWPLPAITTVSPGPAARERRARSRPGGRPRPRPPPLSPMPARISAMIASGSSERGLSEVTTARSESSAPTRPICGRLSRSRSPPAPKTEISLPCGQPPRRAQHVLQRVRGVGVVDEHRERLALVDRLEAPRDPPGAGQRPRPRSRRRPRAPSPPRAPPSALATLKWPGSAVRTPIDPSRSFDGEGGAGGVEARPRWRGSRPPRPRPRR